jgi:hypothetical protein
MIWLVSPNSAEVVPKVRPVDISSVVYMPSFASKRNALVRGEDSEEFRGHFDGHENSYQTGHGKHGVEIDERPAFRK